MEDKKYCVYMHTNIINGKKYIGQTCRKPEQRWGHNGSGYLRKYKDRRYNQPLFAHAILKYGWDNFTHEIIEDNLTKKEADKLEKKLIKQYNTTDSDYGYNISKGGSCGHMNETTKQKIKESNKEYYKTHQHHTTGTHRTEDFKKLMHEKMLNREFSEETRKKMSKNHNDVSGGKNPRAKPVICIETGEEFPSAADAGRAYGLSSQNPGTDIRQCCKGKRKSAARDKNTNEPLHWEWIN